MKITNNSTLRMTKKTRMPSHMTNSQKPLPKIRELQANKPTETKDKRRRRQRSKKMTLV